MNTSLLNDCTIDAIKDNRELVFENAKFLSSIGIKRLNELINIKPELFINEDIRQIDYLKHQNRLLDIDIQSKKDQIKHLENMKKINDDCLLDKLKTDNEHIIKLKVLKNDYEKKLNEIEREKIKDGIDFIKNL